MSDGGGGRGVESQRRRVVEAVACGVVAGVGTGFLAPWQLALLVGWSVVAATVVGRVWARVGGLDAATTAQVATREDDSRATFELLLVGASVASLVGVAFGVAEARDAGGTIEGLLIAASVLTVVLSWAVVHTVYALRYAHLYYRSPAGGIEFPARHGEPDYQDFAYVAFTVGMTFQVSDTAVRDSTIRRAVLRHALLSYVFGAVILAVVVNAIANVLG